MVRGRFSGHGLPAPWIVVDTIRMADGVLAEHWDVVEDEASRDDSVSGLPMFGDSFPDQTRPLGMTGYRRQPGGTVHSGCCRSGHFSGPGSAETALELSWASSGARIVVVKAAGHGRCNRACSTTAGSRG
jgi:hypothetical protein